MPHSILMGRPWPKPGEPLFTPADTQLALELQAEEDLACVGCGHPRDECMDPDNEQAYEVNEFYCDPCAAKAEYQRHQGGEPGRWDGRYLLTRLPSPEES